MKDDSLSDTQKNKYCPKCDKYHDWKFDCSVLKPQIVGIVEQASKMLKSTNNVYATEIWNEAIEAAYLEAKNWMDETVPDRIRKLKK